jgi:hypothetical protein
MSVTCSSIKRGLWTIPLARGPGEESENKRFTMNVSFQEREEYMTTIVKGDFNSPYQVKGVT